MNDDVNASSLSPWRQESGLMTKKTVHIENLMGKSNVQFGTSGSRGLVNDMTDEVCYAYTAAFIQYLEDAGELSGKGTIAIGGDLRPSTDRIMSCCEGGSGPGLYTRELRHPSDTCPGLLRPFT
jgi:hypothetical protein